MPVITVDSPHVVNAIMYGSQVGQNEFSFQRQLQNLSGVINLAGNQFIESAKRLHDKVNNSSIIESAKRAISFIGNKLDQNTILFLDNITDIQKANFTMQRWIMADPFVRNKFHNQEIDGYSNTYVDKFPSLLGDNHYDYRRVMDGVLNLDSDNENEPLVKFYFEDLHDSDQELTSIDKFKILDTWDVVRGFLAKGEKDPTSFWNEDL